MNSQLVLSEVAFYSETRINGTKVSRESFVTTDSMLQNKGGISNTTVLPKGNLIAFSQGDILIGNIRPYLKKIWYAKNSGGCSPDVLVLKSKPDIDSKFLYYSLFRDDFFSHMMKGAKGTKMPRGDKNQILRFHIPQIHISTQQKIASVLSTLDAKIELNNEINKELEAMAKTLYDYWFVQFDFPDENGKPYKSSGGKMVWSEELKREIPERWEVEKLGDLITIDKSGDWGKDKIEGNFTKKVVCFRGADINGLNGLNELNPPTRYILEKNSFKILQSHDLIIEISGGSPTQSTGRLGFITNATMRRFQYPLICSNFCKPISLKNKKLLYNFVYYWNKLYDNGVFFGYEGKTSGIKNLLLDSLADSYYMALPEEKIVNKFYDFIDSIQEKKQTILLENQKLTELRDWLLPMLMNGQVKIN
ncbi:hypothetical protein AD998_21335 [bacterium 336/3]|nr:hypothetical protein AD998_21335 [bacterium 336/3]